MMTFNAHYYELKGSYLFYHIEQKVKAFEASHPDAHLLRLGVGDVSRPLCPAVIAAMHRAVDDQADAATFRGYMPECGAPFLQQAIARWYAAQQIELEPDEIFVTSGAADDLGALPDVFGTDVTVAVPEPTYPAYVDTNVMAGHRVMHLPAGQEEGFLPMPSARLSADVIYLCSPNNPTGAAYRRDQLQAWIDFANGCGAIILFDAAYEAFIRDPDVPHSIYELPGAKTCAVEIGSLSKTAGFTGMRCGFTVVPRALRRGGHTLHELWVRDRTTKTNGVSYITQRGAEAVFSPEGQREIGQNLAVYRGNARCLTDALDACGTWYCGGRNAPYVWAKCPDGLDSWAFFDRLLEQAQIIATPGVGFGACGEGYIRFSSFGSPADTAEAARRLTALL